MMMTMTESLTEVVAAGTQHTEHCSIIGL